MAPTGGTPRFRAVDAALVRVAARPVSRHLDAGPPPDDADATAWRQWARQVAGDAELMAAVDLVSPSLSDQVDKVAAGAVLRPARYRRLGRAVTRYRSRMTRATPLGLFAGIAPARIGPGRSLPDPRAPRRTVRVATEWLEAVLAVLENTPELLRRVRVVVDDTVFVRDEHLVLRHARRAGSSPPDASAGTSPSAPADGQQRPAPEPPAEIRVRHTAAVRLVHQLAATPRPAGEVLTALGEHFPATPPTRITGLLLRLVALGILHTDLRAPMTVTDPLGHLVDRLTAYDAHTIDTLADLVDELRTLHHLVRGAPSAHDRSPAVITDRMRRLAPTTRPLGVDLHLDGPLILPDLVAREAETAATTLTRLAPPGSPHLRAYHQAFLERYGPGALVRLTEVIDTDTGLGWPQGYRDAPGHRPPPSHERRDTHLLTLAFTAVRDHVTELVLDEDTVTQLATDPASAPPPAHFELGFRLHAADHDALARGDFRLVVFTASRAAGTMTGRVLDLLDPADRDRMTTAYRGLPTTVANALPVQLSCPPLYADTHDIARSPAVLTHLLHLTEHPSPAGAPGSAPHSVPLTDLALHGDNHRLHLVSLSQCRVVQPHLLNAVELTRRAHPLARLLCDLEAGQTAMPTPFPWGAARRLPFLPRVRHGRTVLSPARWRLTAGELPDPEEPSSRWATAVDAWRARTGAPDTVLVGTGDRQLRLTLTDEHHLRLLRTDLHRHGTLTLTETPTADELAWLDGHMHEIVLPLARATPPLPAPRLRGTAPTRPDHAHLPGHGRWLYLKIYAHPDRHHTILRERLPDLFASWSTPPDWWFLPYRDPDHHLRLRLAPAGHNTTPTPTWQADALTRIGHWTADLRRRGLTSRTQLDTYLPEIGRFGDGPLLNAAEAVFVADSAYVLHQHSTATAEREAVVAAGLVDLAVAFLGDATTATRWLISHLDRGTTPSPPRTALRRAQDLTRSTLDSPTEADTPSSHPVEPVVSHRHHALATYAHLRRTTLDAPLDAVLPALLHLHCVRALGLDRDAERTAHHLARTSALGHHARHRTTP